MTALLGISLVLFLICLPFALGGSGIATLLAVVAGLTFVGSLWSFRRYAVARPLRPEDGELLDPRVSE
ncbi:hypothetical protein [Engelhardtia mirabilis]|uniref:Uncharacterized protein n=1 Tax=Engelhardtia mirabilis TaxID=2528011 RepID=A0A518BQN0_9BACT|nr:hypothetical protein Pla133_43680 [Planctomycetes bacterium Pla133]QDV03577.1 hypothetical protein Pla86_43670 [Planctomycetes bacterium Pla86]